MFSKPISNQTLYSFISLRLVQILLILWLQSLLIIIFLTPPRSMQPSQQPRSPLPTPIPFALPTHTSYPSRQFRAVLPILRNLSRHSRACLKLPLLKVLAAMAKLFQLSHIEALFLVYLVRETEWATRDPLVVRHSPGVRDILYTQACDDPEYKNLVLYLTLACFSLKESLSDHGQAFQAVAESVCPTFAEVYQEWSQKYAGYTSRICPEHINRLYTAHAALVNTRTEDYVGMVDDIIDISPEYDYARRVKPQVVKRISQGTLEQPAIPVVRAVEKRQGKLEIEFQAKFFSHFAQDNLAELVNVGTTNDFDDDFMLGKEEEGGIGFFGRAHSDPLSEDEECEEENLPPLYEEHAMFLPPPEDLSRELQLASINESNFGIFAFDGDDEFS